MYLHFDICGDIEFCSWTLIDYNYKPGEDLHVAAHLWTYKKTKEFNSSEYKIKFDSVYMEGHNITLSEFYRYKDKILYKFKIPENANCI